MTAPPHSAPGGPGRFARLGRFGSRRVPIRLQASAVECGVACLAMVLGYHRRHVSLSELREQVVVGRDGATAGSLARAGRANGLAVRGFRAGPDALPDVRLPLIAHWGFNHFVVIERLLRDGSAVLVDPAVGRRTVDRAELATKFTGVLLELSPTEDLQQQADRGLGLGRFVRPFLPRSPRVITVVIVASALLTLLGLVPALLTRYLIDTVIPQGSTDVLGALAFGVVGYAAGHALVTLTRSELLLWLQTRIDWSMMRGFVDHLFSLPYRFFQLRHGGDLLQRVSSTAYVRDVVSSQLLAAILDIALLSVYLVIIGFLSVIHVVVIAGIAMIQVAVMVVSARRAQRLTERELRSMSQTQSTLLEAVSGAETVKASGAEASVMDRWSAQFADQLGASVARRRLDNLTDAILGVLRVATPALMIWLGAYLVIANGMSLGDALALNALAGAALAPVGTLGANLKSLQTVRVHLDRLRDVFDETPEDAGQGDAKPTLQGRITLSDVSFRYGNEPTPSIADVDLDVPKGAKIAIVGQSGSGKSTLSRLLLGLHQPSSGLVCFDDLPLQELDLRHLRAQCGVVTQDSKVFSGSVLSNITLTTPDVSLAQVQEAARLAAIHDDVVAMPMGYETVLGEGGAGLSGGQAQRLALARALLTNPRVLLLDEATSHLDAVTEAKVHRNLAGLHCTRVVIAHRLSTVRDADRIVVMDHGRIAETGTHTELLAAGGTYADLVGEQVTH